MTEEQPLLVEHEGGVVTLTINDPPHNRMGIEFMNELERQVEELSKDRSARAIVITAAGEENFSVGMPRAVGPNPTPKATLARLKCLPLDVSIRA